jgi:hypothetical protein
LKEQSTNNGTELFNSGGSNLLMQGMKLSNGAIKISNAGDDQNARIDKEKLNF